MHRLLGPSTTGPKQRNNNIDNLTTTTTTTKTTATDENGTLHFVRTKKRKQAVQKKAMGGKVWADLAGRLFRAGGPRVGREAAGGSRGKERRKSG